MPPSPGEDPLGSYSGSWHPGWSLGAAPPFSPQHTLPWEPAGNMAVKYLLRVHSSAASTSVLSCAAGRCFSQTACCPARGSGDGCSRCKFERIGRAPWVLLFLSLPLRGRSAPARGVPLTPAHPRGRECADTPEQEPGAWSRQHLSGDACFQVLPGRTSSGLQVQAEGKGLGPPGMAPLIQDHTQKECGHVSAGANETDVSQCCL